MRDYGKVYTAFWTSEDVLVMTEDERTLALYLLTCPHGNMLGCFRLPDAYASDDMKWTTERVSKGFSGLVAKGYIDRCARSYWVLIKRYLKWNQFENPNVGKAAGKLFGTISPPPGLKLLLAAALREFTTTFPVAILDIFEVENTGFGNPSQTLSSSVLKQEPEPEPEPEPQPEPETTPSDAAAPAERSKKGEVVPVASKPPSKTERNLAAFEVAFAAFPRRMGSNPKPDALKSWNARIAEGVPAHDMIAGAQRYAEFNRIAGKVGTEFVMQAVRFFGRSKHFAEPWEAAPQPAHLGPRQGRATAAMGSNAVEFEDPFAQGAPT